VARDQLDITESLLEKGALVNMPQQGGYTPLHGAAQNGNEEMVRLLLKFGADAGVSSEKGETAADMARKKGFESIARILESPPAR
jgi:ankyrin repeat protein